MSRTGQQQCDEEGKGRRRRRRRRKDKRGGVSEYVDGGGTKWDGKRWGDEELGRSGRKHGMGWRRCSVCHDWSSSCLRAHRIHLLWMYILVHTYGCPFAIPCSSSSRPYELHSSHPSRVMERLTKGTNVEIPALPDMGWGFIVSPCFLGEASAVARPVTN